MERKKICSAPGCVSSSGQRRMKFFHFPRDSARPLRQLYKLTDTHMNPTGQSPMKVNLAAKVTSHTIAASPNALVATGGYCSEYLATYKFIEEVDNLFDSFNKGTLVDQGKTLRCPLSDNSPHIDHWKKAGMGINIWIFLMDGKRAFLQRPPSQTVWLIDTIAAQHVWRTVKEEGFKYLHTRNLNQDPLENKFGAICLNCGCNNNPTVAQFVTALKTSITNGLVIRGLCGSNCEDDGATVLDKLQSLLRAPDASSQNPSTSHGKETPGDVPESFHVAQQVQDSGAAVHAGGMEMFSVAYVTGSIARQVLRGVSSDACKTCLTSEVLLPANVFIYFKVYSDTEQPHTYPSEKLVETVGTAVTLMESVMAEVARLNSVQQHITVAIKNSIVF